MMFRSVITLLTTLTLALVLGLPARPASAQEPGDAARGAMDMLLPEPGMPTLVGPWEAAGAQTLQVDDEPTSADGAQDVWRELPEED